MYLLPNSGLHYNSAISSIILSSKLPALYCFIVPLRSFCCLLLTELFVRLSYHPWISLEHLPRYNGFCNFYRGFVPLGDLPKTRHANNETFMILCFLVHSLCWAIIAFQHTFQHSFFKDQGISLPPIRFQCLRERSNLLPSGSSTKFSSILGYLLDFHKILQLTDTLAPNAHNASPAFTNSL